MGSRRNGLDSEVGLKTVVFESAGFIVGRRVHASGHFKRRRAGFL